MLKYIIIIIIFILLICLAKSHMSGKPARKIHHSGPNWGPDFSDWDLRNRLWKRRAYGWGWDNGYYARPYYPSYYNPIYYNPYSYYDQVSTVPTKLSSWADNGYLCFEDGKNGVPVKRENNQVKIALNIPDKECSSYINKPMGITNVKVCNKDSQDEQCKPYLSLIK